MEVTDTMERESPATLRALFRKDQDRQAEILGGFSPDQQQDIK